MNNHNNKLAELNGAQPGKEVETSQSQAARQEAGGENDKSDSGPADQGKAVAHAGTKDIDRDTAGDAHNGESNAGGDARDGELGEEDGAQDEKAQPGSADGPLRPHFFRPRLDLLKDGPRVLVSPEAYMRMCLYIELAPKEVGWQGTVTRLPNGDFFIEKTFLLEQEVTSVETELTVRGREKLTMDLLEKGGEGLEEANRLRFWGHSHVRMGTHPSGTDENTMRQFQQENLPWYIRGIFTKLGKGQFTVYLFEEGIRIWDASWAVWDPHKGILLDGSARMLRPLHASSALKADERGGIAGGEWAAHHGGAPAEVRIIRKTEPKEEVDQDPYAGLPPELVPSKALRREVSAEYRKRVKDKHGFFDMLVTRHADADQMSPVTGRPLGYGGHQSPTYRSSHHQSKESPLLGCLGVLFLLGLFALPFLCLLAFFIFLAMLIAGALA
ncbi:MAG TPA: hypothetical protein V6D17_23445 [Candidatus Obscuribacterales bacterium]